VVFYAEDWLPLETKITLKTLISEITGIDPEILLGEEDLGTVSIARRMSWAAKRQTTRLEDIAYCLMSIFDVNMPLLYREGAKAFIRLQEEIMKSSDDHTLFVWKDNDPLHLSYHRLLASSPAQFERTSDFKPYRDWKSSSPYSLTNKGLSIQLFLIPLKDDPKISVAVLECQSANIFPHRPAVYLKCLLDGGNQFARIKPNEVALVGPLSTSGGKLETIFIRQQIVLPTSQDSDDISRFWIQPLQGNSDFAITEVYPPERWDPQNQILQLSVEGQVGAVLFKDGNEIRFAVILGEQHSQEWCEIEEVLHGRNLRKHLDDCLPTVFDKTSKCAILAETYSQEFDCYQK
jgi:hypothetical protein